jgi:hypothetical protein
MRRDDRAHQAEEQVMIKRLRSYVIEKIAQVDPAPHPRPVPISVESPRHSGAVGIHRQFQPDPWIYKQQSR